MVQFNLLPDIKLEYIKARRMKRLVVGASMIITGLALAIFILLFLGVNVVQKRHLSNLDKDIASNIATLESTPDINKVLTVQNQLNSLTALHTQKPAASRFVRYLMQVTPKDASISQANVDFALGTITISGSADSLKTVNKYTDTLKFTTFTTDQNQTAQPAFTQVVLAGFGVGDKEATYQLSMKFNPEIFNNTLKVELKVPDIISTRSETEKPADLFQELPEGIDPPETTNEPVQDDSDQTQDTQTTPTSPVEGVN